MVRGSEAAATDGAPTLAPQHAEQLEGLLQRLTHNRQADLAWRLYSQMAIVRSVPMEKRSYNCFLLAMRSNTDPQFAPCVQRVAADMANRGLLSPSESEEQARPPPRPPRHHTHRVDRVRPP